MENNNVKVLELMEVIRISELVDDVLEANNCDFGGFAQVLSLCIAKLFCALDVDDEQLEDGLKALMSDIRGNVENIRNLMQTIEKVTNNKNAN